MNIITSSEIAAPELAEIMFGGPASLRAGRSATIAALRRAQREMVLARSLRRRWTDPAIYPERRTVLMARAQRCRAELAKIKRALRNQT